MLKGVKVVKEGVLAIIPLFVNFDTVRKIRTDERSMNG